MIYKITLTPLERFFFGGETVFGDDGQSARRRSYLVQSNFLPQQSGLLGLLREQLLRQNDLLLNPKSDVETVEKAGNLVGEKSFSPDHGESPYGLIQKISALALTDNNGQLWQPAPLDDRKMPDSNKVLQDLRFAWDESAKRPLMRNLNSKEDLDLQFESAGIERRTLGSFFQEDAQVGITITNRTRQKDWPEEDKDEAYYRQTFYRNGQSAFASAIAPPEEQGKDTFSFVFWVEMHEIIEQFKFSDATVTLGGERSAFSMKVEKSTQQKVEEGFKKPEYRINKLENAESQRFKRIVLLSDAYADWKTIGPHCALAVAQTTPFRYFTTELHKDTKFYDLKNTTHTRTQSELFTLLQRGTVLYADGADAAAKIAQHLDDQKSWKTIGYNFYKLL